VTLRASAVLGVALALGAVGAAQAATPAAEREVLALAGEMERLHPDLFATTSRARFRAEATALARRAPSLSRAQLVVGLMRLVALAGPRNGHTAVYPYDGAHAQPLDVYPLRLYWFPTGLHVVAAPGHGSLVGARLTSIDGVPIERVVEAIRPLVARDNESGFLDFSPEYVVTEQVLVGLGLTDGGPLSFAFADGRTVLLDSVASPSFRSTGSISTPIRRPGTQPLWLRFTDRGQWLTPIDHGRAIYLGYRMTTGETWTVSRRLLRLARNPRVKRVIVDVRLNHGGDNTTYGALLDAMGTLSKTRLVVLLVGRATFSAAANFAADVDALPRVRTVGEPSGGSPSTWGDSSVVEIPSAGVVARVATRWHLYGRPGALAVRPDVIVPLAIGDFLAGRDPVLMRALRLR
jgi:hypothetical protein